MKITASIPDHAQLVTAVMSGFVAAAELEILAGVVPPSPFQVPGLKFVEESGTENWMLPHEMLKKGGGDCEDWCFWHTAGLHVTGEDPAAACVLVQTGPKRLHCVVMRSDGSMDDPSLVVQQRQKLAERHASRSPRAAVGASWLDAHTPLTITPGGLRVIDHRTGAQGKPTDPGVRTSSQYEVPHAASDPKVMAYLDKYGPQFQRNIPASYASFGKAKRDTSGAGLQLVTDDQDPSQTPYWLRPSDMEQAAWAQGMSPDDLQQQMLAADQWSQFGFGQGLPSYDAYGGFPSPFGFVDPYMSSAGYFPSSSQFDESIMQMQIQQQAADEAAAMAQLGVDPESVVDGDGEAA